MEFIKQEKLNFTDWTELTDEEKKEFDWLDEPLFADFFRYRGLVYCVENFSSAYHIEALRGWDGYSGDSFFSGVVIRLTPLDPEFDLDVATYIC